MKRLFLYVACVALVFGFVPVTAFATIQSSQTDAIQPQETYDVSDGQYEPYDPDTNRRLYTRAVTLTSATDADPKSFQSTAIDLQNPIYEGADIAVRYTGDRPYLAFYDTEWRGWTSVYASDDRTVAADDGTGEHVAFFPLSDIEARWAAIGGNPEKNGGVAYERQCMSICVSQHGSERSKLVEAVAVGCAEKRIDPTSSPNYQAIHGKTAFEIAQDIEAGYNLAGHFEANYVPKTPARDGGWTRSDLECEAHWTRGVYITHETLHNLKNEGFKAVRLPVTWFQHIYPKGDPTGDPATSGLADPVERYHIDRAWMERVHEVVDWCLAEGFYVILNIHHEDWIDRADLATAYDSTDLPVKFAAVWTQIANEFAGYDQHLIFEDMNEPHAPIFDPGTGERISWGYASEGSVSAVNRLNADFVRLMRTTLSGHSDRLLMMAHDTGSGEIAYTNFVMPEDPARLLAYSVHCYTPHAWTHYLLEDKTKQLTGEYNVYTPEYRAEVEAAWDGMRMRYTAKGDYPIILGEFGCSYYTEANQAERLDWMTQFATHAKELGIPMFYWRMDRTKTGDDGIERVVWSAFDEVNQEISPLSKDMLAKWFAILADDDIEWGSYASVDAGEHASLESGKQLTGSLPKTITGNHVSDTDVWRVALTGFAWADIEGNEVAVEFSGSTPRLGMMKNWTGDWWGMDPDSVDYEKGIAYFKSSSIATHWAAIVAKTAALSGATEDDIDRLCVCTATSGSKTPLDEVITTEVKKVAIVHQHDWGPWEVSQEPTCEQPGAKTRVCSHDNAHVLSREIDALGHEEDEGVVTKQPTQTEEGVRTFSCTRCGKALRNEPIARISGDAESQIAYAIKSGADAKWTRGGSDGLVITSEADFSKFVDVRVDDETVDGRFYDAVSGSTRITLHADYLDTLGEGVHSFSIRSTDGEAATHFTVEERGQESGEASGSESASAGGSQSGSRIGDMTLTDGSQSAENGAGVEGAAESGTTAMGGNDAVRAPEAPRAQSAAVSSNAASVPKAGDATFWALTAIGLLVALAGMALVVARLRRRDR